MQLIDSAELMHFPHPFRLRWRRRVLHFKRPATTSRGALTERVTYIIEAETTDGTGIGECCTMPGLLPEPTPDELDAWCSCVESRQGLPEAPASSPIQFGLECALLSALHAGRPRWDTPFTRGEGGIPIHHLVWMDGVDAMLSSIHEGIQQGFSCVKMKVGALPFGEELGLLQEIHAAFPQVELRVDANGAFIPQEALRKLEALAAAGVACIEQPIRPGKWKEMQELCWCSPLPIALDEELIGTTPDRLFQQILPQHIVIKPSLHGGLLAAQNWACQAEQYGIGWWINSALESQVGLTALAEWCSYAAPGIMQGLGKGNLFADDAPGPIRLVGNCLYMEHG